MAAILTGCAHQHTWIEATCEEPKRCQECDETEGEPLGHDWVEATCEKPKTCSLCGLTEGEPGNHIWMDATYAAPKTCSVCGLTEGEPLPEPYCEKNGIVFEKLENMDLPFAMAFVENGKVVELDGVSIEHGDASYTFGKVTCAPSEQDGYIDVVIPYRIDLSRTYYLDASKHDGSLLGHITYPDLDVGDYYTGIIVPTRTAETGPTQPTDTVEGEKTYEWNGNIYSIRCSKSVESSSDNLDWVGSGPLYHKTKNFNYTCVTTITIPKDFDGAVLRINRALTEVTLPGDKPTEETDLLDGHNADDYIFYRLSDLIDKAVE